MTALTVFAAITIVSVAVLPGIAELVRIRSDRRNPIRRLRGPTRRMQALDPSQSFA
jgi:hypothetical protein